MPLPGPLELGLILIIVAMLFGVGKLPEVFGAVGKGIREFRKESSVEDLKKSEPAAVEEAVSAPASASVSAPVVTESAPDTTKVAS